MITVIIKFYIYIKKNKNYFVKFTLLWLVAWIIWTSLLILNGKSLIWNDDSLSASYEQLLTRRSFWREFFYNLIYNHEINFSWNNYNLTAGDNVFCMIGNELFTWISYFFPARWMENAYSAHILIRSWFSGITFSVYCLYRRKNPNAILVGSLIYSFCGYALNYSLRQPFFIFMLYMLPLILLGIEYMSDTKRIWILAVSSWMLFMNYTYLAYYVTIAAGIYFLSRCYEKRTSIREFAGLTIRLAYGYLLGFALSAFASLPYIIEIINSGRLSTAVQTINSYFLYDLEDYLDGLESTFLLACNDEQGLACGISALALIPLLYTVFFRRGSENRLNLIVSVLLVNIPLFNVIAGAGMMSTRWIFYIGFLTAYICTDTIPEIFALEKTDIKLKLNVLSGILILIFVFLAINEDSRLIWAEVLLLLIGVGVFDLIWIIGSLRRQYLIMYSGFYLWIAVIGVVVFSSYFYKFQSRLIDYGTADSKLNTYVDSNALQINDDSFYRVDKQPFTNEMSCNLPEAYGFNGISSFGNMLEAASIDYFQQMENTGILQNNKYAALGTKITDETLACVKYYLIDESNNSAVIPYGFSYLEDSEQNEGQKIYINDFCLPIGFTYATYITEETFEGLNIAEKQEILLKTVLLEGTSGINEAGDIPLYSKELDLTLEESEGIDITGLEYSFKDKNSYITFSVSSDIDGEIYLQLSGLSIDGTSNGYVIVSNEYGVEEAVISSASYQRTNGMDTYTFNVGKGTDGRTSITVSISRSGINISSIKAYVRDLSTYETDINTLRENTLENISVESNIIEGDISVNERKALFMSVPYSKGWKCYIDDEQVDILKANLMYMAVMVEPGEHHVKWIYTPYGLNLGITITLIIAILILIRFIVRIALTQSINIFHNNKGEIK